MSKKLWFIFAIFVSGVLANDSIVDFGNYDIMSTFQPSYTDPVQMISMSSGYDWDDDDEKDDDYKSPYYGGGGSGYDKEYCPPAVPEPSTYTLIAGIIGLGYAVYRKKY